MNKSIILIALCVLISTLAVVHSQKVSVKFVNDYLVRQSFNQIEITFDNVDLAQAVTFTAQQSKADADASKDVITQQYKFLPKGVEYTADVRDAALIGLNDAYECIDVKTNQHIGGISFEDDSEAQDHFTFQYAESTNFRAKNDVDGPFGSLTVRCLLALDTTYNPEYFNLNVDFYKSSTEKVDPLPDIDLLFPAKGYITPLVEFKSLSLKQNLERPSTTTAVDVEFSTDTVGMFRIETVNAPTFQDRSHITGDYTPLYCSSGSDKKFARFEIYDSIAWVTVLKVPQAKQTIKCSGYIGNDQGRFVISNRSSVTITAFDVKVSRSANLVVGPGVLSGKVASSSTSTTINLGANGLFASTTPINYNSTLEFTFSKTFDVSQLVVSGSEQQYRSFVGCSTINDVSILLKATTPFGATVFVNKDANTITLKDCAVAAVDAFTCEFKFSGSDTFAYDKLQKMGAVSLKIDGKSLVSAVSNGNDYPLYLASDIVVESVSHEETLVGTEYTVVDVLSIADNYVNTHRTPTDPVLILSIGSASNQDFAHNDHAKQLVCELSTPTDSKRTALKLTFDESTLSWSAPLKDIVAVETFNLSLQCTRKRQKIVKNGLEITPLPVLQVQVIDLIDGTRFIDTTRSHFESNEQPIVQPTAPSTDVPKTPTWFAQFNVPVLMKKALTTAEVTAAVDFAKAAIVDLSKVKNTDGDEIYKDFSFTAVTSSPFTSVLPVDTYFNASAAEMAYNYYYNIQQHAYVPFYLSSANPYSRIQTPPADKYTAIVEAVGLDIDVWMNVKNTDFAYPEAINTQYFNGAGYTLWLNELEQSIYEQFMIKSGQSTTIQSNSAYWGSPVTACGYTAGHSFELDNTGTDFTWTEADGRNYGKTADKVHIHRCDVGQSCTVNSDCAATGSYTVNVCKAGTCTTLPSVVPKYIAVEYDAAKTWNNYQVKQYFNASPVVSTVAAFAAVVVVAAVFMF